MQVALQSESQTATRYNTPRNKKNIDIIMKKAATTSSIAPSSSSSTSSYDAFASVDRLVSKPVLGSDGAASWQSFRRNRQQSEGKSNASRKSGGGAAPTAPLKKSDRLGGAGFQSWTEERRHEDHQRLEQGLDAVDDAGYTHFRKKKHDDDDIATGAAGGSTAAAVDKKERKRILAKTRPDDVEYFLPAQTFQGSKFDYVYTTRHLGLGYYWDGTDSLKRLGGETAPKITTAGGGGTRDVAGDVGSGRGGGEESSSTSTTKNKKKKDDDLGEKSATKKSKKKKRKQQQQQRQGPVIVEDPNNPREQFAAVLLQRQQQQRQQPQQQQLCLPEGWESAIDSTTGKTYYFCRATDERRWDVPPTTSTSTSKTQAQAQADAPLNQQQQKPTDDDRASSSQPYLPEGWSEALDASSGKTYYYNASTRQTKWERPSSSSDDELATVLCSKHRNE